MADGHLLGAAERIADGEVIDWASVTSTLRSDDDRAIADELAVVQQIAFGHRQLHQLLPAADDTPPDLMPDRARWGHLDLLNVVGRGSYGMVYRAWDTRLERLVALKLFHGASDPGQVMQEGRMLARVRHENVVAVYGADVIDGVAGIWMELVHGKTLDSIVKASGPLPAREAAAVGADVARALGAVHAAGLLHCDVKAQNVVREKGGRVVLMDFGAGRLVPEARDGDQLADVAGTPRYMAPELFLAASSATRASDIYSLGVLIYYLSSGEFPVGGKTLGELRRAHDSGSVRSLAALRPELPKPLTEIVTRAIDRDPALRPWAAVDMQSALAEIAFEADVEPVRSTPAAWWAVGIVVAAALAIALLQFLLTPAPPPPIQSIAVMPIRNLTGDPQKQYLADGLTEVLVAHLAGVPGLHVASSATMATLRGLDGGERALAEKLGVRLLLAGSVVQADDRIILSVQLNDPREGRTTWGTQLERHPSNILSARSEIARLLAARLSLSVPAGIEDSQKPLNAEAQDAYLRGLVEISSQETPRILAAGQLFTRAVGLEPNWAEPRANLALAQQLALEFGDPSERNQRAQAVKANALRAIQLNPRLSASYTALAAVQAYNEWDLPGAESTLRQGISSSPSNATAHNQLAFVLAAQDRLQEALREAETARDQEPLLPQRHSNLAIVRYYARDFDGGLAEAERALAIAPNFALGHHARGRILTAMERHDDAIASLRTTTAIAENPGWLMSLAMAYARAGRTADRDEVLRRVKALEAQGTFVSIDNYGYLAAYDGRRDEAFRLLGEAIDRRMTNVLWLAVDPRADVLRADARFDALLTRMGLVTR